MPPRDGVIFVATGDGYIKLALRAAESLKAVCPDLPIDLFADQDVKNGVFDRVVRLENPWVRSKIDGMLASRFERTLYLDADLFVIADLRDVFEVLDRFDLALTHDPARNSGGQEVWRKRLPPAYPQFNGGMIAYRNTDDVRSFLHEWKAAVFEYGTGRDQPTLRELLWDSNLRVAVLPEEYNLLHFELLSKWWIRRTAPRILHSPKLHQHIRLGSPPIQNIEQLIGPHAAGRLPDLLAADHTLAKARGEEHATGPGHRGARYLRYVRIYLRTAPFRLRLRRWYWSNRFRARRG